MPQPKRDQPKRDQPAAGKGGEGPAEDVASQEHQYAGPFHEIDAAVDAMPHTAVAYTRALQRPMVMQGTWNLSARCPGLTRSGWCSQGRSSCTRWRTTSGRSLRVSCLSVRPLRCQITPWS
eukprot:3578133-Rhodomonas_salina.2